MTKRVAFLPIFFTVLAVAFGIAVWVRLSAFEAPAPASSTSTSLAVLETTAREPEEQEEMVLVPADEDGNPLPTTTASRSQTSREQRYQELLRSAPPKADAQTETRATPSLIDRMVAPIANAIGMNRPKPVPPAKLPPQPRPEPQPQPQPQARVDSPGGDGESREQPRQEDDPETDTTPPQLVSAQFIPPEVQDDAETTFAVMVTDDLSGVRSVSGVITSPSGALQGFACQREGATDRFLARIKVPRDAAEGVWLVKYLTLADQANNSVHLNQSSGSLPASASFRVVSSGSDSTAPLLKAVWLDRLAMTASEKNLVFVQAEDDRAGVSLVSGVFVSPSKQARMGFGCRPGPAGPTGAWECTVSPPACLDCGRWQLEQIQVQDRANNMATFRNDHELVRQISVEITGDKCDSRPPAITALSLDPLVVSNAEGGVIRISAVVSDDACGVASLSGQAIPAGGNTAQRIHFSFDPSADGVNFVGKLVVPKHAAKGIWTIAWIQALDRGHNLRAYSSNDPVVGRATFRVE